MAEARIEHTFNCSEDTYWDKVFFDEEYNRQMFLEALGFESWTLISLDETEDQIRRVVEAVPTMRDLPGPLKKLAESGLGYRETATFDKKVRRVRIEVEPKSLAGKLSIRGELRTEPAGEGKCRRIYQSNVEAKVFGVGGMIEKRIMSDVKQSYDKAAVFTNEFLARQGLS